MKSATLTRPLVLASVLWCGTGMALAQEAPPPADPSEPQIVIRHTEDKTFYEYRVNGVLKEIKVVPSVGPEYYLIPADGGGWIREDRSTLLLPSWVIFRW